MLTRPFCNLNELPHSNRTTLQRYNISGVTEFAKEMSEKGLGKPKISLQFELSQSGITELIKAEAAVEENYTVVEEVEVDDDDASDEATEEGKEEKKDDTKEEEKKEGDEGATDSENTSETKKKKTIQVEKVSYCLLV